MYIGYRLTLSLLCTTFIATGLVVASIGPALPELARQTDRTLASLGTLFIALFGGGLLAQVLSGMIADRFGRRIVWVVASVLYGAGALAMSYSTRLPFVIVFATLMGLGYGGISLAVNVLSSEIAPDRRATTLNLVNVFFGVGAIAGPILAGLTLDWWGTPLPALRWGAILCLLVPPLAAIVDLPAAHVDDSAMKSDATRASAAATPAATTATATPAAVGTPIDGARSSAFVWCCAVLLLLYAGSEASVGSWTPVYLRRTTTLDASHAATITSAFWASLCVGRVLAVLVGLRFSSERLITVSFIITVAGALLLLGGHGIVWLTVVGLSVLGLAYGPIYPTMMAVVTAAYPRTAGAAASRLGAFASIGGMILPGAHGLLLTRVGTWSSAAVTLTTALVMLAGWMAIRDRGHRERPVHR